LEDYFGNNLFFLTVTTVDSGNKALEFLGLQEDDKQSQNQPSVSPDSQQVSFSAKKKVLGPCISDSNTIFFIRDLRFSC